MPYLITLASEADLPYHYQEAFTTHRYVTRNFLVANFPYSEDGFIRHEARFSGEVDAYLEITTLIFSGKETYRVPSKALGKVVTQYRAGSKEVRSIKLSEFEDINSALLIFHSSAESALAVKDVVRYDHGTQSYTLGDLGKDLLLAAELYPTAVTAHALKTPSLAWFHALMGKESSTSMSVTSATIPKQYSVSLVAIPNERLMRFIVTDNTLPKGRTVSYSCVSVPMDDGSAAVEFSYHDTNNDYPRAQAIITKDTARTVKSSLYSYLGNSPWVTDVNNDDSTSMLTDTMAATFTIFVKSSIHRR